MTGLIHSVYYSSSVTKTSSHFHDCHQIIFIKNGTVELTINGIKQIAKSGDAAIVNRLENHSIAVLSENYERYILRINPLATNNYSRAFALLLNRPKVFNNIISMSDKSESLERLFQGLIAEIEYDDRFSNEYEELLVKQILIEISRKSADNSSMFEEERFDIVFLLQRRFEQDYSENYSLEALAKEYHISTSTLSHQFKKITGYSVFDYLLSCRIASAKYYLTKTDMQIGEIVEACGFTDCSNFSRKFKNSTGITPTQFRKEYSKK